jgi:glycosyltransferase involved in cell wall biosynthesis
MKLLVASHDASRTGAPLVLLTFLRWLRRRAEVDVQLVLWRGGPLVPAFAEVAEVTVLHPPPGRRGPAETLELGLAEIGLGRVADGLRSTRVRTRLRVRPHDVCYLNGAGSALVLPHLRSTAPSVAHVHELDRGLTFSLQGPGRAPFLGADRVVAVAQVVADRLVEAWGVDRGRVVVLPGCLPDRVGGGVDSVPDLPDGVPLVLSVGAGSWRKGVDLFLQVAAGVRRAADGEVRFAWVGPLDDPGQVAADLAALDLTGVVDLPGEIDDPEDWYARAAVFCSTAREDPYPLVGLEAGAAGVPIVAFASGGIVELLADGRGTVVGPMDVPAMVEAVVGQLADPGPGSTGAELLADHVAAHHTIEQMGPTLLAQLEAVAAP